MAKKRLNKPSNKTKPLLQPAVESPPASPSPLALPQPRTLAWIGFCVVLLACIFWIFLHAFLVDAVTVRLCERFDAGIPPEKRLPVFLSEIAFDGYVWNRHAEHLGKDGAWRLRFTDFDNAPDGREVHWNSAFAWYLRALGELHYAINLNQPGASLRNSIFRMSIWANPILLILAVGIFSTLSARRFGPLCGTVIAIGMISNPSFYEGFQPAYPDHHGLIAFTFLGFLFGIAWAGAGWVKSPDSSDFVPPETLRKARHGMIFSAISGAAGFWISAVSTAVVLGSIGLAALVSAALSRLFKNNKNGTCTFHPELWKTWALWGAGASFAFYLIEYFPSHMGMRLEVNHPLYALGWIGGGWIVATISEWLARPKAKLSNFPWKKLIIPALCCVLFMVVVLVGGDAVYSAKHPFLMRLYANILELLPLKFRIEMGNLTWAGSIGFFPLLAVAAIALLFIDRVGKGTKLTLGLLVVPILCVTALQFYQTRWGMLSGPLYVALAGIVIPEIWKITPPRLLARGVAVIALLGLAYLLVLPTLRNAFVPSWSQFHAGDKASITYGQGLALLHRQMARAILDDANGEPVVLLSSPNSSVLLSALGGFRTVGTLYWENVAGLEKTAKALNAQSEAEAFKLICQLGITHISFMSWENFIEPYFAILYPEPVPDKDLNKSFGKLALFDKTIPAWTRPLIFPKNDLTAGLNQSILMLRVAPEQSLVEANFHIARFAHYVEQNPVRAEIAYKDILKENPELGIVRTELIKFYFQQKRFDDLREQALIFLRGASESDREQFLSDLTAALLSAGRGDIADQIRQDLKLSSDSPDGL